MFWKETIEYKHYVAARATREMGGETLTEEEWDKQQAGAVFRFGEGDLPTGAAFTVTEIDQAEYDALAIKYA